MTQLLTMPPLTMAEKMMLRALTRYGKVLMCEWHAVHEKTGEQESGSNGDIDHARCLKFRGRVTIDEYTGIQWDGPYRIRVREFVVKERDKEGEKFLVFDPL